MSTTRKRTIALLLTLALLLSLCACTQKQKPEPDEPKNSADRAGLPTTVIPRISEEPAATVGLGGREPRGEPGVRPAPYIGSEEGKNSLLWLRDRVDFPQTMFGMAYLGYVGVLFDEGFEAGFPEWLRENNEALLSRYPFIAEIDESRIIGGAGHLYCIVPVDEKAEVVINRVQWDQSRGINEVTEALYRSETGEPVLLFANLDGVAYETDTQVLITDSSGNTCEWEPSLDAMSYLVPCVSENGDALSFDFTEYAWLSAPSELAPWLADGWSGMTALGLAGSGLNGRGWFVNTTAGETNRKANFSLRFYPNGTADLHWSYEKKNDLEEMWTGYWTLRTVLDGPSYLTFNLSLVGGRRYGTADGPLYINETYPLLISPSGTELLVGEGENGANLPFLSQSTIACVLTQIEE